MKLEEWSIKNCWICGEPFIVKTNLKTRKILTKCFHSYINKHYLTGWYFVLPDNKKFEGDFKVEFKNLYWKVIGYTKFQRWIVYGIWKLFHFGMLEYWECDECAKGKDD